ncbi:hypothetical protein [Saccharothrix sp. ALI-22-I]|uniref:hypothetical protein n=1 Tax=Saccharothrix sp. ALI-22-I TaxID=1933778 RepID=UPI0015C38F61|nr:hypothetical protein [Saccharothrix sp. ALI-22-I]
MLADQIWLIIEGMYASAAHPGGERAGEVAVDLVASLTGHDSGGSGSAGSPSDS